MRKHIYSILIALLMAALIVTPVLAGYTISPKILVGQTNFAGVVKITGNPDGSLTFLYMVAGGAGWCIKESQIHIGLSLADFPTSPGGVSPGQFDYKYDFGACITSFTTTIYPDPVDPQWSYLDNIYIAIHVVADNPILGLYDETGWVVRCGNLWGAQFPGDNWAAWIWFPTQAWY